MAHRHAPPNPLCPGYQMKTLFVTLNDLRDSLTQHAIYYYFGLEGCVYLRLYSTFPSTVFSVGTQNEWYEDKI